MSGNDKKRRSSRGKQPSQRQQPEAQTRAQQPPQGRADSRRAQRVIAERRARRRRILMLIGGGIAGALILVVALIVFNRSDDSGLPAVAAAPALDPSIPRNGRTLGAPDAPVTVVEWGDYQCPACAFFWEDGKPQLIRDYVATGKVKFEFRDYTFLGQESVDAAIASVCADRQGKFWEFHDLLYFNHSGENQGAFSQSRLRQMAELAGLDMEQYSSCLGDPAVAAEVSASLQAGRTAGISSTPTFVVNDDQKVSGASIASLRQLIDAALAGQ